MRPSDCIRSGHAIGCTQHNKRRDSFCERRRRIMLSSQGRLHYQDNTWIYGTYMLHIYTRHSARTCSCTTFDISPLHSMPTHARSYRRVTTNEYPHDNGHDRHNLNTATHIHFSCRLHCDSTSVCMCVCLCRLFDCRSMSVSVFIPSLHNAQNARY